MSLPSVVVHWTTDGRATVTNFDSKIEAMSTGKALRSSGARVGVFSAVDYDRFIRGQVDRANGVTK